MEIRNNISFSYLVTQGRPYCYAAVHGNDLFPQVQGTVLFYPADSGTLVVAEVFNLPYMAQGDDSGRQLGPFYAFHLHEGEACGSGAGQDPFTGARGHYNPAGAAHPSHAGDFPALLGNSGYAYLSFYTGRFAPSDIVGKTVVIHENTDDFHTQPSGASGTKLACGAVVLP